MIGQVQTGDMVFLAEGREGIGAVRELCGDHFVLYVENAGEFEIPAAAIQRVHDHKVMIDPVRLPKRILDAVAHAHDREDPKLAG
ncbi:MAG: hypothetical protein AB7O43_09325 [Hyphomicrobiaceae bacterium]